MMSDYIKIVLNSNYEFRCDGELSLYGMRFVMLSFKIDTGCQYSVLPLIRTGLPQNMILQYRDLDFSDSIVGKLLSYGVNDTEEDKRIAKELYKNERYSEIGNMVSCVKEVDSLVIGGVDLGKMSLKVNYTRTGNILIGMDILKLFDIHIAPDRTNGDKTTLLACPLTNINDNYLFGLEESFGISRIHI